MTERMTTTTNQSAEGNPSVDQNQPEIVNNSALDSSGKQVSATPDVANNEFAATTSQESEIISRAEALRDSPGLLRQVRHFASDRVFSVVTGVHVVNGELETGSARIRQVFLERKRSSQQRKYERYSHLAKSSAFGWRREKFRMKSFSMRDSLNNTRGHLSGLNKKFGERVQRDANGNKKSGNERDRGSIQLTRKNRYKERLLNKERQRAREVEKILARKERLKRSLGALALTEGSNNTMQIRELRDVAREHLEKKSRERLKKVNEIIDDSKNRWRWYRDSDADVASEIVNSNPLEVSDDNGAFDLVGQEISVSSEPAELELEDSVDASAVERDLAQDDELMREAAESAAKALEDLRRVAERSGNPNIQSLVEDLSKTYKELLATINAHGVSSQDSGSPQEGATQ